MLKTWRKFYIFGARLRDFWQFGRLFGPFGLISVNIDHFQSTLIIFSQSWTFSVEIGRFWSELVIFRPNCTFFGRIEPFFVEIERFLGRIEPFFVEIERFFGRIEPFFASNSSIPSKVPFGRRFGANRANRARIGRIGVSGGVPGPTYQGGPLAQSTGVIFGGSFPGINEALFQCSGADFSIFSRKNAIFGRFSTNFVNLPWSIDFACHCVSRGHFMSFLTLFCSNSSIFWSTLTYFDPNFQFFGQLFQFLIQIFNFWSTFSILDQIF